jgi:hypothetical protein
MRIFIDSIASICIAVVLLGANFLLLRVVVAVCCAGHWHDPWSESSAPEGSYDYCCPSNGCCSVDTVSGLLK